MIQYALFIYSEMFHKFLDASTYFQNLVKASICMEKKFLDFSRKSQNVL